MVKFLQNILLFYYKGVYCMIIYIRIFLYGIVIGSFLNVCIYRIPRQDNSVITRCHSMKCGT
ncbi:prepilin peptidase, partial [Lachnoclostridium sp.]|uniref:prepilin peptidase n=1 Tax=Lachnoclostridium sp. TaxID=2028282 RepID=UPI00289F1D72